MDFSGEFTVPGHPDEVMRRFADIERMARCMPGASLEGQDEDGNYLGVMTVTFGPKRLKFRGLVNCDFDMPACSGVLRGRAASDARGARVSFETRFRVTGEEGEGDDRIARVRIDSTAELGGVLAEFARTGGTALANVMMKEFAANLSRELSAEPDDEPAGNGSASVSATKVLWGAVKQKFQK